MNNIDINIYFKDEFNRLCILASAGGTLPKYLLSDNGIDINPDTFQENNNTNSLVYKLPKKFQIGRNPLLSTILKYQYPDITTQDTASEEENISQDYNFTNRYNSEFLKLTNNMISTNTKTTEFSDYFLTFDDLAARGFFVYDKLNINYPSDDTFILVSYPIYDTENSDHREWYNKVKSCMASAPKLNTPIIDRFSNNLEKNSFKDLNLIEIINSI